MNIKPELIVFGLEKFGAQSIFKFWKVERLPPVVTLTRDVVKRPKHKTNFVLVVSVNVWSNPPTHHCRNLSPQLWNSRLNLNVAENQLPTPSYVGLSVLEEHHLHELFNPLIAQASHVGGKKN